MSKTVNVAEFKDRFSEPLAMVEKGGEVIVCRRNVPLARVEPIRKPAPRQAQQSVVGCMKGRVRFHGDLTEPCMQDESTQPIRAALRRPELRAHLQRRRLVLRLGHLRGVFFASYIQAPEDMAIQFIGRSRPGRGDAIPRWIKHLPQSHGVAANHRPAGSTWDPSFDDGFKITLASGFSDFEYVYPFYFGRSGENVLVLMFEQPRDGGEMRFAQSPSPGGTGNPAWDFVYFRRDYTVGDEFKFRVRAVYRRFTNVEDIVRLYERPIIR